MKTKLVENPPRPKECTFADIRPGELFIFACDVSAPKLKMGVVGNDGVKLGCKCYVYMEDDAGSVAGQLAFPAYGGVKVIRVKQTEPLAYSKILE